MENEIVKIVLTGGPCGGKTSALCMLEQKLRDRGVPVIFVPEMATTLITSGLKPWHLPTEKLKNFQTLILKGQFLYEDELFLSALQLLMSTHSQEGGHKGLLICDRGLMDSRAYMSDGVFQAITDFNRWDRVAMRDRYNAVIHMVTAANGAEKFYNLDNPARTESPSDARELDMRTQRAWLGHSHLRIVDNTERTFEQKLDRVYAEVLSVLGLPVPIETERKYLVRGFPGPDAIPVEYQVVDIEQFYLESSDPKKEVRVRKRSQAGAGASYYRTLKFETGSSLSRTEIEERITEAEYYKSLAYQDRTCDPIRKMRFCFLYNHQYFELDFFMEPRRLGNLTLLELELTNENDKIEIPPWLGEVTEVTDDPNYRNKSLAQLNTKAATA